MATIDEILDDLKTKRDELKLKIHLGSKEVQEEWEQLETRWREFSSKARVEESAEGISAALRHLKDELVRGYERVKGAL